MEWLNYILLAVLPAIAAFAGGILLKASLVVKEHIEDQNLIKELMNKLADKENPMTPQEFKEAMEKIQKEFGETKEAWKEFINEIKRRIAR